MITETLIGELKQSNVSLDAEKTKLRVSEVWKTATKDEQNTILALTGLTRPSLQRVYKTGSISAKIIVVMAQTLNLDPFYLTGEADEHGVCSDDLLRSFLVSRGYEKLLPEQAEIKPKRRRQARQTPSEKADPVPVQDVVAAETVAVPVAVAEPQVEAGESACAAPETAAIDAETQAFIDNATEDEIILLVKSILLREKAGGKHAETAQKLKLFLLS